MLKPRFTAGSSLLVLLVVSVLVALPRLVHIEADTPDSQWHGSVAIFVDEGYKTLSARNLVLFGMSHWNPADDYPGWLTSSALTQWPYFVAFRLFGAEVGSARLVTVLNFLLLLAGFVLLMRGRYSTGLLLVGVLLLGVLETLFFFSRVALFEVPIAALTYFLVFLLGRLQGLRQVPAMGMTIAFAFVVTLGIKSSGLLYFVPIIAGLMLSTKLRDSGPWRLRRSELGTAVLVVVLAALSWDEWGYRFDVSPMAPRSFLLNPLTISSGLLIAAGLLTISHGLLTDGRSYLADAYRTTLVALVTLGPLLLVVFPGNPLRYYVPLLPAFVLLVVEWLHLRQWQRPIPASPSLLRASTSIVFLVWAVFSLGQVIDQRLLTRFDAAAQSPWFKGSGTGLWNSPRFLVAAILGLILGFLIWKHRQRALAGRPILAAVVTLVVLESAQGVITEARFFAAPSHEAQEIAALLEERLPEDASIAGDWAPRFALGTTLKALYMTTDFNHPRRILKTRPDYYVFCDDPNGDGRRVRQMLREATGVSLGEPVVETSYVGFEVIVYPLRYSSEPQAESGATPGEGPALRVS